MKATLPLLRWIIVAAAAISVAGCTARTSVTQPVHASSAGAININTASAAELEKLPRIGKTLAARIVEFRENNGPFRRTEYLMLVQGISEKHYREIRDLITAE